MLKNYLTIALRSLRKHPGYTFINVSGLAIGMACGILIFLSVRHDLSFDRFHTQADRIVRVMTIDAALGVSSQRVGITLPALGPTMKAELPEVENTVRLLNGGRTLLSYEDRDLYAESVFLADSTFFSVFDYPLLAGNPATALTEPNSLILTETLARRLFGTDDVLGRTIRADNDSDLRVTGVMADVPSNSHLDFDALQAIYPTEDQENFLQFLSSWNSISMITYALLHEPYDLDALKGKLDAILRNNDVSDNFTITLQPLTEAHLGSADILYDNNRAKSDTGYVYALAAVGLFVLLIAAFNFMNLATARSSERAREVGLRKVVGAPRRHLIFQHLGESFLLCLIAFVLALGIVYLALPAVNGLTGKDLTFHLLAEPGVLGFLVVMATGVALLAGSYPAFVLSHFQPLTVLRGDFKTSTQGNTLRKVLVVTQFTASIAMIIGSLVVTRQLDYIMEKNMGYDREQVLVLSLNNPELQQQSDALKQALLDHPGILDAARSSSLPGQTLGRTGLTPEGADEDDNWITSIQAVDGHYLSVLGIDLVAGRNFGEEYGTDQQEAIIINEAAMQAFGWQEALGKTIRLGQQERQVVGVVQDFHFASVRHQIEPMVMVYQPSPPQLSFKIDTADLDATLAFAQSTWERFYPDYPFEYTFLDDQFAEQYREESNFASLSRAFTLLAIFIGCLGLFGLAAFTAEQRTKEIGIRKVLGASVPGLVALLSKEFLLLVGLAFLVAVPISYFAMYHWLDDFAYRIEISWPIFLISGLMALGVALLTVSYQAVKAALSDPVKSLRYE